VQQRLTNSAAGAGDETSSNDGSLHRSEVDYSTLAKAEAAAQDSSYSQVTSDTASTALQRSRPMPTSSDAGHLAQAGEQHHDTHYDANGSLDWSDAAQQDSGMASVLDNWSGLDSTGEAWNITHIVLSLDHVCTG